MLSKRPNEGIATQKAFSLRDVLNGLGGTDEQAITAAYTALFINRDAHFSKRKNLRGTNVRAGTAGSMAKTATHARMRHLYRRG